MEAARSKTVEQWFVAIEQGQIVLPRFQRHVAWADRQIIGLFENILRKRPLPIGVLLILDVGQEEPFISRPIESAPKPKGRPQQHLLDGQQRMTALWKTLENSYDNRVFFLDLAPKDDEDDERSEHHPVVDKTFINERDGKIYPRWTERPDMAWHYRRIPLHILRPGDVGQAAADNWVETAAGDDIAVYKELTKLVADYRSRIASYPIPFLSLGSETSQETALDVFINMNTSSTPLKAYDIVVAQHEGATGESLHEKVEALKSEVPMLEAFAKPEDMILSVTALLSGKPPIKKSYLEPDFGDSLARVWPDLQRGFRRGMAFLRELKVYGERLVPAEAAIVLTLALWALVEDAGADEEGNARAVIENTFWLACLTDRFAKTSSTRTYQDFKTIAGVLQGKGQLSDSPLFDTIANPLPSDEELLRAGWPKRKDRLPRAILLLSLQRGALDFADGSPFKRKSLASREYHHLYPVAVLGGERGSATADRALNCALITWKTNRKISADTPEDYIRKRTEASNLGDAEVRKRLKSHLIPYKAMIAGDYDTFLRKRAKLVRKAIDRVLTL